jgi:hypothetical protein
MTHKIDLPDVIIDFTVKNIIITLDYYIDDTYSDTMNNQFKEKVKIFIIFSNNYFLLLKKQITDDFCKTIISEQYEIFQNKSEFLEMKLK